MTNIQRTLSEQHRPSKELLLQPLPLDIATALGSSNKEFKRTQSSLVAGDSSSSSSRASGVQKDIEGKIPASSDNMLPLPAGGLPTGNNPALAAAAFSATPSEAARQLQQLSVADLDFGPSSSSNGSGSGSASNTGGVLRPSNVSVVTSGSSFAANSSSGSTLAALVSPAAAAAADRLRDSEAGQAKKSNMFKEPGEYRATDEQCE